MVDVVRFVGTNLASVVLAIAIVANVGAAVLNVVAFAAQRRRLHRVIQRERRLDAGPVTSAVAQYARGGTGAETPEQREPEQPVRRRRAAAR